MQNQDKQTGGCHCGQVRFEMDGTFDKALSCNCSICSKRGSLLAFIPREKFTLLSGKEFLTEYLFNKKKIHHTFCSVCGILPFAAADGPDGKPMQAINVRCLDNFDEQKTAITHYDGKSK